MPRKLAWPPRSRPRNPPAPSRRGGPPAISRGGAPAPPRGGRPATGPAEGPPRGGPPTPRPGGGPASIGGGPGGGPNCASAAFGATSAAPNITLTDSITRFFFDMRMSFDLEFWSDGDGFHPLARHGRAKRRPPGPQSTTGSGAAASDCSIGALLTLGQGKVKRERIPYRAGAAVDAATQAACQVAQ